VAQNVYDSPEFFAAYSRLERSVHGLDGAPEWPSVRALLPPLRGARVVDLGCGFGAFARWAAGAGAAEVVGIDLSERMLARAREATGDGRVRYEVGDLDVLELPAGAYDLAYSALALHYVADLDRLVRVVHRALRPGGRFVLTTEHPIFMAPTRPDWLRDGDTRVWPVDRYADEGLRVTDWLAPGVRKFHRTLGTTVNALVDAGFAVRRLVEWSPTAEQVAAEPALAEERDRPMFLLVAADTPAGPADG
jgi:SAM-dependent methyltransferase